MNSDGLRIAAGLVSLVLVAVVVRLVTDGQTPLRIVAEVVLIGLAVYLLTIAVRPPRYLLSATNPKTLVSEVPVGEVPVGEVPVGDVPVVEPTPPVIDLRAADAQSVDQSSAAASQAAPDDTNSSISASDLPN